MFALVRYRGHTFYNSGIETIVDLGAHKCEFLMDLSRSQKPKNYFGVELNRKLIEEYDLVALNKMADNFEIKNAAAVGKIDEGTIEVQISKNIEASSVHIIEGRGYTEQVQTITLNEILNKFKGGVDLIKIDIEGAEISLLENVDLLGTVKQITIEFHDFAKFVSEEEVSRCIDRLKSMGFMYLKMSIFTRGDCLFLNKKYYSAWDFFKIFLSYPIVMLIQRFENRLKIF